MSPERLLKHFDKIVNAPDAIPRLRRFILDLAVRGKLVEQNPKDEPAFELIKKIASEKERLVKKGLIKKGKVLPAIASDEVSFHLPEGWLSVRLGMLCGLENGDRSKNYPSRDELVEKGIPFINAGHLDSGKICLTNMNYITQKRFDILKSGKVINGDILFCLRGSLGKIALVTGISNGAIASSLVIIRLAVQLCTRFMLVYLSSPVAFEMIKRFDNGTAQPNLSSADLGMFVVPLPPLTEQQRIVAKVDELETQLGSTTATRRQLLEATLHEALQP